MNCPTGSSAGSGALECRAEQEYLRPAQSSQYTCMASSLLWGVADSSRLAVIWPRQIHTESQQYHVRFAQREQTAASAIWPWRPAHRLTGGQSALERRTVVGTSEVGPDSSRSYTKAVRRGRNISLATFLGRCMMAAQTARPRAVWKCIVCSTKRCVDGQCFWEVLWARGS